MATGISISGIGAALGPYAISNQALEQLSAFDAAAQCVLDQTGIGSRRSILPPEYIAAHFAEKGSFAGAASGADSSSPQQYGFRARASALAEVPTPSLLGAIAARQALERAGLTIDDIGLIVADCATPEETCPAEAQRISGLLGSKAPAYDMLGLNAALPLFVRTFLNWKEQRRPKHTLFVSSNTPTRSIGYGSGIERLLYGDAAGAAILSTHDLGRFVVCDASFASEPGLQHLASIDLFDSLQCNYSALVENTKPRAAQLLHKALAARTPSSSTSSAPKAPTYVLGLGLLASELEHQVRAVGAQSFSRVQVCGDCLGSLAFVELSELWDSAAPNADILSISAGMGVNSGHVLLTVR
jgi:3-oxoacyl-[acyl-carrier-protein] synthase III